MDSNFDIRTFYNNVVLEKDGSTFSIERGTDGDIWFSANEDIKLAINFSSRNRKEWQSFIIFENLMKLIIGRYVLNDDNKEEYSILPEDFVNLENKIITWYSDGEKNNKLQLQFKEKQIEVTLTRDENTSKLASYNPLNVRIRTSGSKYEYYYQEFEIFFNELFNYANQVTTMNNEPKRKLSLFKRQKK